MVDDGGFNVRWGGQVEDVRGRRELLTGNDDGSVRLWPAAADPGGAGGGGGGGLGPHSLARGGHSNTVSAVAIASTSKSGSRFRSRKTDEFASSLQFGSQPARLVRE